jgi:hypothetical protein
MLNIDVTGVIRGMTKEGRIKARYSAFIYSPQFVAAGRNNFFFPMAQQPLVCQGLLIMQASRSHSDTPHSVGPLWTSDQPDAEMSA